jgi:hypothetical protein
MTADMPIVRDIKRIDFSVALETQSFLIRNNPGIASEMTIQYDAIPNIERVIYPIQAPTGPAIFFTGTWSIREE